jgi:hypothetical protein
MSEITTAENPLPSVTPTTPTTSWVNTNMITMIINIISFGCLIVWYNRKFAEISEQIKTLSSRFDDVDSVIERHENVLSKIMTLLNNRQQPPQQLPQQPPQQPPQQLPQQPPQQLPPQQLPKANTPFLYPTIVELPEEKQLDAELKLELSELIK